MLAASAGPRRARGRVEHATPTSADSLWDAMSRQARETLSETTYKRGSRSGGQSLGDDGLVVAVPNDFTRDWIESHFQGFDPPPRRSCWDRLLGLGGRPRSRGRRRGPAGRRLLGGRRLPTSPAAIRGRGLNRKYTFDLFVIGSSNRSPTPPRSPWPRRRPRPTTRCSSTAAPGSARRTSCRRSPTTWASTLAI